uniref:FZ domain-containing protein n=1 Tax=Xiphophorus couchianus TaxID=32473 RepID=A0A3B5M213_9TELE
MVPFLMVPFLMVPLLSDWITCLPLVVVLVTAACLPLLVVLVLTSLCPAARCEPITLELCMNLPYNQTSFPNFLGHLSQRESSVSWESSLFPALVQTGCYQYLMFYACTLLVPKCDPLIPRPPSCRSLCRNAKEKCESVLGIVGLQWPEDSDSEIQILGACPGSIHVINPLVLSGF